MNTLDDLQAQLDRGQPAGVRGIPADLDLWGIETAEVVFRRRGGLIEAFLRTPIAEEVHGLGRVSGLGRQLAIGATTELEEAIARVELLLMEGIKPIVQPAHQFLAMAGAMLSGLTLVALGECGNFHGLEWRCIEGVPTPILRTATLQYDALVFWATALDGTADDGVVQFDPTKLMDLNELGRRFKQAWLM